MLADRPPPSLPDTQDVWFAAIGRRDRSYDGHFFYGVATTGVYCRVSCASRAARRENVSFHQTAESAEKAGFRPCKRCQPDRFGAPDPQVDAVRRACRLIEGADEVPSLATLAASASLSPFHFHRVFKKITGVTPKAYANGLRAQRMADSLRSSATVTEAIYEAGFSGPGRFYEAASGRLGMTPTAYRQGGKGVAISFATAGSSLGEVLVAATEKGVCAILLGDEPAALRRDLEARFPNATLLGGDAAFEETVAAVVGLVEMPRQCADIPLDIGGSAFQQRVWQALRSIPAGETASYTDIARMIGQPAAARAVARACAGNPLAVAIPCHRLVRKDGDLAGYRWGIGRKRALLAREAISAGKIAPQGSECADCALCQARTPCRG